jgi:anion-transporting  ArsA/GET3 family ATPase
VIRALVREKRILVCVGPGGAGKTTTSAAVGALAARCGRRTLVATIDPAPRLADALGTGGLTGEPRPVPPAACRALGIDDGGSERLFAVRLDTERTFARLVEDEVADPEMRRRIFHNTIYRQITTTLTGSQEYAATLALHAFAREGKFDLVVLDTPPTANALDFLDAPARIRGAVQSPAIKWFARPADGGKRFSLARLRTGGALVLRRLAKLVGSSFLDDLGAFLVDFQTALGGFLARADAIDRLLRGADVAFLLVLSPVVAAVDEALYFHARLARAGIPLGGFVANRVEPAPGLGDPDVIAAAMRAEAAFTGLPETAIADASRRLAAAARAHGSLRASEHRELARLAEHAPGVPVTEVPLLDREAEHLAELRIVADSLWG